MSVPEYNSESYDLNLGETSPFLDNTILSDMENGKLEEPDTIESETGEFEDYEENEEFYEEALDDESFDEELGEEDLEEEWESEEGEEYLSDEAFEDESFEEELHEEHLEDSEDGFDELEHTHDEVEFEEEESVGQAFEAFRPLNIDDEAFEGVFWEDQVAGGGRSKDFKLELELNYGMERAVGGAPQGVPFGGGLPEDTKVTTHTKASDGFEVVMDGPRMEIETRRIGLEQPAELDRIMRNILGFVRDLRRACQNHSPRTIPASANPRAGKVRDFHLPVFASPDFRAFPIKDSRKQKTWFRQSCRVGVSPQCTIDVPLESVMAFVIEIKRSQGRGRSRRWTGRSSSRAGLRSDALYDAQKAVLKSFRAQSAAGRATNRQLTRKLAGFMILLVQYLRTSEIRYHKPDRPGDSGFTKPDAGSRDHEQFAKAYVPLVVHTHFHVMFHDILNSSERTVFMNLYGNPAVRQNLFDLALDRPGSKSGSAELFPARTRGIQMREFGSVLTWDQLVDSAIDVSKPIKDTAGNISLPTPLSTASKGVAKTGPAGARVGGVRLEMRRMGYRWWRPNEWRRMGRRLYNIARKLNGI